MPSISKPALMRAASALNVAIDFRYDRGTPFRREIFHEIVMTAPDGFKFAGPDVHEVVLCSQVDGAHIAHLYPGAMEDLASGVVPCPDPDCEWCHGEEA